jgi:hypothetical protein
METQRWRLGLLDRALPSTTNQLIYCRHLRFPSSQQKAESHEEPVRAEASLEARQLRRQRTGQLFRPLVQGVLKLEPDAKGK